MRAFSFARVACAALLSSGFVFSQSPPPGAGPGPDRFMGPQGGQPFMNQEMPLLKKFDGNSDGWLSANERKAAREYLQKERAEGRGGRQFGGRMGRGPGPGGGRENQAQPEPGEKVSPSEVKNFGNAPFYAPDVVRTLFIEFDNADWEKELSDFHNTDVEVPAKVTVDGKTYEGVGVHFRGMSSYMGVSEGHKRSLNLSVDYVHKDQEIGGYRTLNLLNAHEDPSFLRPILFYDIAREYIPAPKANFVRVVINGEDWGVYNNVQQFNKDFVKENFGTTKGARWKVRGSPGGQGSLAYLGSDPTAYKSIYTIKTKDDPKAWAALIEMCRVLNQTPAEKLEKELSPLLDIDGALKFLALDNALINNDGYWIRTSDYSIYQDVNGKFHILPQDANETFAKPGGPGGGIRIFTPAFGLVRGFLDEGDVNKDGQLTGEELKSLGEQWFAKLDTNKAGQLTREEFANGMLKFLPEPRFRGRPPGDENAPPPAPRGAGVSGALFEAADANKDGKLVSDELKATFARWGKEWDGDKNASLNEDEMQKGMTALLPPPPFGGPGEFRGGPGGPPPEMAGGGPREGGPQRRTMPGPGRNMPQVEGVKLDPLVAAKDETKPLISKLLAVPALRERYLAYVRDIAEKHLAWQKLGPRAERYHKLIADYVKADTRKLDTNEAFDKSLTEDLTGGGFGRISISLKNFADQRREYLLNYKPVAKSE
jgi:spore coat protein CotH